MDSGSLREIALAQGTDKEGAHSYADAYERHLGHLRDRAITLLEIGIGGYADPGRGGASLRMWKQYFPQARIVGLDIEDKARLTEDRITILQGDQGDRAFLEQLGSRYGPFDVVIDDGSHRCKHVITSFEVLFPFVRDGGVYAIEDLQTSYWEKYGGSSGANRQGTSMTLLQRLADGLNYQEFDVPAYEPSYTDRWVQSLTFYHNLAFIQKGGNLEPSNQLPPHPRSGQRYTARAARSPRTIFRRVVPLTIRRALVRLARAARARFRDGESGKAG
jgi:hypothetical protein